MFRQQQFDFLGSLAFEAGQMEKVERVEFKSINVY